MRLDLVISSLGCGGAERVAAFMANHWAADGRSVRILTLEPPGAEPFFPLDPAVRVLRLGLARASTGPLRAVAGNLGRVRALRRALLQDRPDAVVGFMDETNVLAILAALGTGLPVAAAVRNDPERTPRAGAWRLLRRATYPLASAVVVQTSGAATYFQGLGRKVAVVPNPVVRPGTAETSVGDFPELPSPCAVAVGKLHPQKGFDILLRAFARAGAERPEWSLVLIGEGAMRPELEALRGELGLRGRVLMPGRCVDMAGCLAQADLFVLSSRYEGFPNVLAEAMACGAPVLATDCGGVGDLVRPGVDGVVVPVEDEAALARAMEDLMADRDRRRELAARAPEVLERFGPARVMAQWDDVLRRVVAGRG